jgi:hypothetical protein
VLRLHSAIIWTAAVCLLVSFGSCEKFADRPGDRRERDRWERRTKCRDLAEVKLRAWNERQRDEERRGARPLTLLRREFCFNTTLNTCIYDEHWVGDTFDHEEIEDLMTGAILDQVTMSMGGPSSREEVRKQTEFEARRAQLFRNCAK